MSIEIYLAELTSIIKPSFQKGSFPEGLAEAFLIFLRKDILDKGIYRPISIISHMTKVFERLLFKQIDNNMNDKLLPLLTGFRNKHNT